jgi:actin-like ATPase involved in cell morphogenesis
VSAWVLGVDLGTSFSAAAVADPDGVRLLEVAGERRVPSTVFLEDSGGLVAGTLAQRMVGRAPDRAERNPKRYVGRGPMLLGGEPVTATAALAALLRLFVDEGTRRCGAPPAALALTHPVSWGPAQRTLLAEVGALVLPDRPSTLVEEPVAAAVHYVSEHGAAGDGVSDTVAVYDLGGGTFDTAVLAAGATGFEVVGRPGGAPDIGGESFDERIAAHFGEQLATLAPDWWAQARSSPERRWLAAAAQLLTEARLAKEALSEYPTASQYVPGADVDVHLTRAELEDLVGTDVRRTVDLLADTVAGSGRTPGAVFLTGGASRMPLVRQTLRAAYDGLVRTWQDPKTVVALGAARHARTLAGAPFHTPSVIPSSTPSDGRLAAAGGGRGRSEGGPGERVADGVLDAVAVGGALYTWHAPGPDATLHRLRKLDPGSGRVEREVTMGRIVAWAASDELILVAERRGDPGVRLHTLGPELTIRATMELPCDRDPELVVDGGIGWVFLRGPDTRDVDHTTGLPWGETGDLTVVVVRRQAAFTPAAPRPLPIGATARWFVNEDGTQRRLLDPSGPTGTVPAPLGDGATCALVMGRYQRRGLGRRRGELVPRQVVLLVGVDGRPVPVVEQQARGGDTTWIHQLLRPVPDGPWLVSTSVGLELCDDLRTGAGRMLFAPRPPSGVARWVAAGGTCYGVVQHGLVPTRGLSLHVLTGGARVDLGEWPALLGSLASVHRADAPCVRADGHTLWIGARDGADGSQLLRVHPTGVTVAATAPGRLEPVGRAGDAYFALHSPSTTPGDPRTAPAHLLRLHPGAC